MEELLHKKTYTCKSNSGPLKKSKNIPGFKY